MLYRIVIIFLVAFLLPINLNAQIFSSFGIKAGITSAKQDWDFLNSDDPNFDSRTGIDVGVFTTLVNLPVIDVLAELHYVQKGFEDKMVITDETGPEPIGEVTLKPRVDYLSLPILAKVNLPVALSPYLLAGPRFDLLINDDSDGFGDIFEDFETFDFGATFGIGIESPRLTSISLLGEVRYSPSYKNAFDNGLVTAKNRSFEFLVGIHF